MKRRGALSRAVKKLYLIISIFVLLILSVLYFYFYFRIFHYTSDGSRASDIVQVNSSDPECLLISMLPPENFSAEDFIYFRGISTVKAAHRFENLYDIKDFFADLEVHPDMVYLAFDPLHVSSLYGFHASLYGRAYSDTLLSVVRENADTSYEILLSCYSLEYWMNLSGRKREDAIASYRDFVNVFGSEPNVTLSFLGAEEWLIANPGNYETENSCNEAVTRMIAAFSFRDDTYRLTTENMEEKFFAIRSLAENKSCDPLLSGYELKTAVDLPDTDIVFFGDSVIGNFHDSTSIPGVVAGLSGARVYNLGVGGTTAAFGGNQASLPLSVMVEAFLSADTSLFSGAPHVERGIEAYVTDHAENADRKTCFIINYGLNDYFVGMPVYTPASDDETTCYAGALRSAVVRLREAYPDCRIIFMTPNCSAEFNGGTDVQSPEGGTLSDYADAALNVAEKMNVEAIDNFYESGIGRDNMWTYISDGTHPNELGRYIIGRRIVRHLSGEEG